MREAEKLLNCSWKTVSDFKIITEAPEKGRV